MGKITHFRSASCGAVTDATISMRLNDLSGGYVTIGVSSSAIVQVTMVSVKVQ